MPERPDLRQIAENIREALSDYDRDALREMLTYIFKEYVVESPPPVLISQVDGIDELADMSFAQLIETLQTRLDHPELELFRVSDDQVLVRAGGVLTPLSADGAPSRTPMPPVSSQAPAAPDSSGPTEVDGPGSERPTAAEAERRGRGDLAGGRRGVNQAPPPRPRGVSVSSRPSPSQGPSAAPAEPPREPAPPAASESPPAEDDKPEPAGDDDAAVRFSLLELD